MTGGAHLPRRDAEPRAALGLALVHRPAAAPARRAAPGARAIARGCRSRAPSAPHARARRWPPRARRAPHRSAGCGQAPAATRAGRNGIPASPPGAAPRGPGGAASSCSPRAQRTSASVLITWGRVNRAVRAAPSIACSAIATAASRSPSCASTRDSVAVAIARESGLSMRSAISMPSRAMRAAHERSPRSSQTSASELSSRPSTSVAPRASAATAVRSTSPTAASRRRTERRVLSAGGTLVRRYQLG